MEPPMSNGSMQHREPNKSETYDTRDFLQGASCTIAAGFKIRYCGLAKHIVVYFSNACEWAQKTSNDAPRGRLAIGCNLCWKPRTDCTQAHWKPDKSGSQCSRSSYHPAVLRLNQLIPPETTYVTVSHMNQLFYV
jgi:hypothetical protein